MKDLFLVHSSDATLLLALERAKNLQELADSIGRTVSVVSRRLSRIAEGTELIKKHEGRWTLTARGRSLNRWTESAVRDQKLAIQRDEELRVGAPREFCSKFLAPNLEKWSSACSRLRLVTTDQGVEELLLARKIDFAFDCGAPYSPEVAFKRVARETFGVYFGSSRAAAMGRNPKERNQLRYLHYDRFDFSQIRREIPWIDRPAVVFSDIASIRSVLSADQDTWTVLPDYCCSELLVGKSRLVRAEWTPLAPLHFGIWWLREHPPQEVVLQGALAWLRELETELSFSN